MWGWIAVTAASAVIGALVSTSSALATAHAVLTLGAVLLCAFVSRRPEPLLAITCYAGSADVLWRMGEARAPWEASKYAVIIGSIALLARFVKKPKDIVIPALFLLALVPGLLVAVINDGIGEAREQAAANLGGPIAIGLGVMAFRQVSGSASEVRALFLSALSPVMSVATIVSLSTFTAEDLEFTGESNFATSGGFGPNQVSALLGFGGVLCGLIALQKIPWRIRLLAIATNVWLIGQALLTFSRGGVFGFLVPAAAVGLVALTTAGFRSRFLVGGLAVLLIGSLLFSWANVFSEGALDDRYEEQTSTNRTEIASADIDVWEANPVFGVGVGGAKEAREVEGLESESAAHTEYTRLLAEHGLFGLLAIVLLAGMSGATIMRSPSGWGRLAATGLIVWSLAQMTHSATRLGVTAVAFALASLPFQVRLPRPSR